MKGEVNYINDSKHYAITLHVKHCSQLSPSKTSADVCIELCEKANIDSHMLMLEEVICNESMRRIVHIDEMVLDVVLRWGYWDEEDRKDNYLIVKENSILHEMESLKNNISLVCGELKIATESTKAFKLHMFECQHTCLCYFKDKQVSNIIRLTRYHYQMSFRMCIFSFCSPKPMYKYTNILTIGNISENK